MLAIALFGGTVLISNLHRLGYALFPRTEDLRWLRNFGLSLVTITGALLFASGAVRYYDSTFFKIKLVLLVLILVNAIVSLRGRNAAFHSGVALALWAAVIFAARGVAFF